MIDEGESGSSEVSRRTMLGGFIAVSTLAAFGLDQVFAPAARAATWPGTPTKSVEQIINTMVNSAPVGSHALSSSTWASGSYSSAWCDRFVNFFLQPNGRPSGSDVPDLVNKYSALGRLGATPKVGSLVFCDWNNDGSWNHVGFVTGVARGKVTSYEGNTTPTHPGASGLGNGTVQWKYNRATEPTNRVFGYPLYVGYDSMTGTDPVVPITQSISAALEETTMLYHAQSNSTSPDGLIKQGYIYINSADGPLRALNSLEGGAHLYFNTPKAPWSGNDIRALVKIVGLRVQGPTQGVTASTGPVGNDGRLTGEIVY